MTTRLAGLAAAALVASAQAAAAEGVLNIYNWGNYTSPELIEKFEKETGIDVTVTDYDSNDTALAKIEAGGHGFDMVVPSASFVPIFVEKGLLLESRPDQMENFKHVSPEWVNVDWDPGRRYTVPWQWGTTGLAVNRTVYQGDINTSAIFLDPPEELKGKINVVPEMSDVLSMAIMFEGGEPCTNDMDVLRRVRDRMTAASAHWMSMDYGMIEKMSAGDVMASVNWNGATMRTRLANPAVEYGWPREGYPIWMDSIGILSDAQNVENAKKFLNFIMLPENAAKISAFARYSSGIAGVDEFLPEDMKTAPELHTPAELAAAGKFLPTCPPEVTEIYTKIWTELLK
jgi:spermidine/putrescine transport system substrate-binding protein